MIVRVHENAYGTLATEGEWTFVGGSGQLPLGKPSVKKSTAFSDAVREVTPNELSLRHISPDAVR